MSSKAPWFPFYAADFLASPDVQLMEAHEVGAYLLLLLHSWQSDTPGYLPDDDGRLRRVCRLTAAVWAESRALLLSKWPVGDNGQRHNPRLVHEAENAVLLREKKAEAGRKSAERRARLATEAQQSGNTNPTPVEMPETGVGENANYSQPQSQPQEGKPSSSSSLRSDDEGAAPEKKIGQELSSENPGPGASHTEGGGADVGTQVGAPMTVSHRDRGKKDKSPPGSDNPADYTLPEWASPDLVAQLGNWLARRQSRRDCKPLTAQAVQARFNQLARYDETFCLHLLEKAEQNPHWQGLTFDDTDAKFAQHLLTAQKLQHDATRLQQPERGAHPTAAASFGARALSAQLRTIRQERSAAVGGNVYPGPAAGINAGPGPAVPPGVGAPKG